MGFPVINGGVLLLALVVFWLLLFRPRREATSRPNRLASDITVDKRPSFAKRITGWTSLATFAITLASLLFVNQTSDAWIATSTFAGTTVLLFIANIPIGKRGAKGIAIRGTRRNSMRGRRTTDLQALVDAQIEMLEEEDREKSSREWQPQSLPDQLYRSEVGTLEQAVLAEVVSMDEFARESSEKYDGKIQENADATRINLDEILRRRRANGN